MRVVTPSGLIGNVRKLKGAEINFLNDRKRVKAGTAMGDILAACWTSTEEIGPYEAIDWKKIVACDRFFALMCIRIASYGSEFVFKTRCGEGGRGGCGHSFEWEIDLATDLDFYDLPDESRAKLKAGNNRFETHMDTDDGPVEVIFRLLTGADEELAARIAAKKSKDKRDHAGVTGAIARRIMKLGDLTKHSQIAAALEGIDFSEQLELLAKMDVVDGGFDTKIEIECEECENTYEIDLPFAGGEFWTPRKSTKKRVARATKNEKRVKKTIAEM